MATEIGIKDDSNKIQAGLVLGDFARSLMAVCEVGQMGIDKYAPHGWISVPDGIERYTDAMMRHWLEESAGNYTDNESQKLHAAHIAWNALARLDLILRSIEDLGSQDIDKPMP